MTPYRTNFYTTADAVAKVPEVYRPRLACMLARLPALNAAAAEDWRVAVTSRGGEVQAVWLTTYFEEL